MPKHRAGGKFTGSHTTIIDAALVVADTAAKQEEVSKISLGIIEAASSKKMRLKFKPIPAGWEVIVYGRMTLQFIRVFTSDPKKTKNAIEMKF